MQELKNELEVFILKLCRAIDDVSKAFYEGNVDIAFGTLTQLTEGFDWVCRAYMGIYQGEKEVINKINIELNKVNIALENKDYLLTADIFKYEIHPIFLSMYKKLTDKLN